MIRRVCSQRYRTAADILKQMFLVGTGRDKETIRRHTLKAGALLRDSAVMSPKTQASAITVPVDSTFIRTPPRRIARRRRDQTAEQLRQWRLPHAPQS